MKRTTQITISSMSLLIASVAYAGDANTSANASNGWFTNGSAGATANWNGNGGQGFARTNSATGQVNRSRGVAFGVDDEGMDLSFSHAIAPKSGPAYAGTLNMSIGKDGQVSASYGGVVANGGTSRDVATSGATTTRRGGAAIATATGNTRNGGTVQANTNSYQRQSSARVTRQPVRYSRQPVASSTRSTRISSRNGHSGYSNYTGYSARR